VLDPANILVASSSVRPDGLPEWALMHSEHSKPRVFMGLVAYDLNLTAIPNLPEEIRDGMSAMPLVFVLNVGDVSINPSRETLSYDPATCATLTTKLKNLYTQLLDDVNKTIAAEPTLYDARVRVFGDKSASPTGTTSLHTFLMKLGGRGRLTLRWNGQPILREVSFDPGMLTPPPSITAYEGRSYSTRFHPTHWGSQNKVDFDIGRRVPFVVWTPTVTAKTYSVLKHNSPTLGKYFMIIAGNNLADVNKELLRIGWPQAVDVATLPVPARAAPGSRSAPTTRAYIINGTSYDRSETVVDLKGGGYYCEFFDGRPQGCNLYMWARLLAAEYVPAGTRLVGFPRRRLTTRFLKTVAANGWHKLDTDAILASVPADKVQRFEYARRMSTALKPLSLSVLVRLVPGVARLTNPEALAIKTVWDARPVANYHSDLNFIYPPALQTAADAGRDEAAAFFARVVAFGKTKPMLDYLIPGNIGGDQLTAFTKAATDYINS
jgi:hypothetical protein